jgi:hypothetical protein
MMKFIARMIKKSADSSTEEGQELYRKYFVYTKIYESYKAGVDEILKADGYEDVIVSK